MLFLEKRQIVIFCLAGLMVSSFVFFRYLPLQKKIKIARQAIDAQKSVISRSAAEKAQLPALKEQLLSLQKTMQKYEINVPANRDLGLFLQKIADLMNQCNLKEQQIQPGDEIKANGLNCMPVSIQCKGRLKQIFEFYKSLQSMERVVRIERVELVNNNDFSGEINMQTRADIYYRAESKQG